MSIKFLRILLLFVCSQLPAISYAQEQVDEKIEIGSASCQKDMSVLSLNELRVLSNEEKVAFLRSREDESKRIALELHEILTDDFSRKLFEEEQRLGLSPTEPISKLLTVEEIVRRLVILNSVGE